MTMQPKQPNHANEAEQMIDGQFVPAKKEAEAVTPTSALQLPSTSAGPSKLVLEIPTTSAGLRLRNKKELLERVEFSTPNNWELTPVQLDILESTLSGVETGKNLEAHQYRYYKEHYELTNHQVNEWIKQNNGPLKKK